MNQSARVNFEIILLMRIGLYNRAQTNINY